MKSEWHKTVSGILVAVFGTRNAWAVEQAALAPAESSAWGAVGLWIGIAAAALVGVLIVGRRLRARGGASATMNLSRRAPGAENGQQAVAPRGYNDKNVGNDASARPWERHGPGIDAGTAAGSQGGVMIESLWVKEPDTAVPAGFDAAAFLNASKTNFVALQEAWNRSDVASLRAMMTDEMVTQIQTQLAEREAGHSGAATEVVMLDARLLGIEDQGDGFMASVEFSGLLREEPSAGPSPFRELWSITRPKSGEASWLVAGVQSLQ